ncbi:DNA polymerase, partial [Aspergillus sclerotialis]
MPCSEIADSIVQTGRETLEKAIALIHSIDRWDAEVVYGDTDSLFVHLKGRTREEAFDIGEEIAQAVTEANPRPIKLKFEKV